MGENFAWNGEQCDWPVATTVCYRAFAFVQCDEDPVLPVSGSSRLQLDARNISLGMRHLVNAYEVEAGTV